MLAAYVATTRDMLHAHEQNRLTVAAFFARGWVIERASPKIRYLWPTPWPTTTHRHQRKIGSGIQAAMETFHLPSFQPSGRNPTVVLVPVAISHSILPSIRLPADA